MDRHHQHVDKRVRADSGINRSTIALVANGDLNATSASLTKTAASPATPVGHDAITNSSSSAFLDKLPTVALSYIASFVQGGRLSGTCRSILEAIPEVHYKVDIRSSARSLCIARDPFGELSSEHMRLQPSGALASGRVVARVTVTGCTDYKETRGGYQILEKAVRVVVHYSIPTLRSITVEGHRGKDSGRVAAIIGELVPTCAKHRQVAPRLVRVQIHHGANGVVKAGKAVAAGLWPALEELIVPRCHGNTGHFSALSSALRSGCAPNLRVLTWDDQSCIKQTVDESVLWGLCTGKCPHMEKLSFTSPWSSHSLARTDSLRGALQACPNLRELRMDCTRSPGRKLGDLTASLQAGDVPCLTYLLVQTSTYRHGVDSVRYKEEVDELKKTASSRSPPIDLEVV